MAITAGLALAVSPLGVLPAAAQATTLPTTTPTPAPSGMAATTPASSPATAATPAPSGTAASTPATPSTLVPTTAPPTNATYLTTTNPDTAPPDDTNWVTLGVGGAFVSGNKGRYEHQQNTNTGAFGGVDDFHWQQFVGKSGTFTMDGHAIFGNHDYDLKLDLTDPNLGYIRAGYTEYRIWYDSTGGYYPVNGLSFEPYANDLYIDRRNAWIEAGLTLPNLPSFIFRYEYDSREGNMDSTSWGQTTLIPGGGQTKIVPTFLGIDETRNIFSADVKDKVGDTSADLGVRYEIDRTDDSTYMDQNPDQTSNAFITDQNIEKDDLFSVHGSTETLFDKKVTFSSGFSATTIGTDLAGSRIYGPAYGTPLSPTFPNNGSGYIGLGGGGDTKDYVGNLNLMLTPIANLVIVPSARFEYEESNLADGFSNTAGVGGGFTTTPEVADTDNWYLNVAQSVEARYTGFRDWSLYASAEVSEDWGNEAWNSVPILDQVNMDQDWSMLGFKPTIGANWYPLPQLNFGLQYYHEIHDYDYTNNLNSSLVQYPGYLRKQNFTTDDINIRATWQALSTVSLVTRYDFQYSTVDTWSIPNGGTQAGGVESANLTNHIISEDVNWTPLACLYLQVGGSYVINSLDTPVAGSGGINNLVLNGENNYWTLDASAGYEINSKTHLQLQYSYYNADNYFNNAPTSLPFGAGEIENNVTATLTRDISKSVQVSLKYGFYQNRDQTSGGQNDYDAQLVYVSTTFGF
ncbi:MAG TPA: hypothetical protein VGZ93_11300 [Candidatus Methylacidiphilales bacterium]|jgi:hypothetical protein|nr:hypothetical protein [Candidatus Methylacidiphilales bacterium]